MLKWQAFRFWREYWLLPETFILLCNYNHFICEPVNEFTFVMTHMLYSSHIHDGKQTNKRPNGNDVLHNSIGGFKTVFGALLVCSTGQNPSLPDLGSCLDLAVESTTWWTWKNKVWKNKKILYICIDSSGMPEKVEWSYNTWRVRLLWARRINHAPDLSWNVAARVFQLIYLK